MNIANIALNHVHKHTLEATNNRVQASDYIPSKAISPLQNVNQVTKATALSSVTSSPAQPNFSQLSHSTVTRINTNPSAASFNMQTGANGLLGLRHVSDDTYTPQSSMQVVSRSNEGGTLSNQSMGTVEAEPSGNTGQEINAEQAEEQQSRGSENQQREQGARESQSSQNQAAELIEAKVLEQLKARDIEVKNHERAHASVGGIHAQSPSYEYQRGSDGRRYAVGGEVQIDVSPVKDDPQATITKMKQVYAAAMAPVDPSMADIRVANRALQHMQEAKQELTESLGEQGSSGPNAKTTMSLGNREGDEQTSSGNGSQSTKGQIDTEQTNNHSQLPKAKLELAYGVTDNPQPNLALQV